MSAWRPAVCGKQLSTALFIELIQISFNPTYPSVLAYRRYGKPPLVLSPSDSRCYEIQHNNS